MTAALSVSSEINARMTFYLFKSISLVIHYSQEAQQNDLDTILISFSVPH